MLHPEAAKIWTALRDHRQTLEGVTTRDLFSRDAQRFAEFSFGFEDVLVDFSKNRVSRDTLALLLSLARASCVEIRRDEMLRGDPINTTENRSVLHTALRAPADADIRVEGRNIVPDVHEELARCYAFADAVRSGAIRGATGDRITDVVNIGIGGSDLGPAMGARALSPYADGPRPHFVSNVDGADMADVLARLDPARTLFLVSSKTFTTIETMTNAGSARRWIAKALGETAVGSHFAAISTNIVAVEAFGISKDRMFRFWDWVGGRYSMWSAIGLGLMIAIGPERFAEFLAGGHEVDVHFATTPLERNIPVLMGLVGIWHRNIMGYAAHAVLPYDQRLGRFPAYLQQLDMESNGKHVHLDGTPVEGSTGPLVWGEPGTNGQHAFYQLIHQGTDVIPADFLIAAEPHEQGMGDHHAILVANCLAQTEALMHGRTQEEAKAVLTAQGLPPVKIELLAPHKQFAGSRPTTTIAYRKLDPRMLGRLVALYEHKVFVQGVIWGINSFDQWGVELGKELASRLLPVVKGASAEALDASTRGLVAHLRGLAR
ncbi:glucose-6-phosphate isomerase [Labrys wisconsinensis]|uniref:Glucose-6-phosphate isomerase n=1 Tax=Labrys wisconsinensis TaxID=425677 RepID=A0ABU0J9E6_9HYPH|nr:glucose-6-phosphate isomerase [Labrys wisconsinensis]MDQ0469787.1 glucose-6-phosphate isomerase [Labrys wisconsinensis]